MTDQPHCAQCGAMLIARRDRLTDWYQLSKEPGGAAAGSMWKFCTFACLSNFVRGGDDA